MSEDEKETPELRLGLQSCLQPGFRMEKQWNPGVRVTCLEEFDQFTEQLAQSLMDTYSPEHIATVAAQRIILLDMSQCVLDQKELEQDAFAQILTETIQNAAFLVYRAHRNREAKKRMAGGLAPIAKRRAFIRTEIERHAKQLWDADAEKDYRVTEMAGLVRDAVERDYPGESPRVDRIKELIKHFAPQYARQGGAPKGKRTRSKP